MRQIGTIGNGHKYTGTPIYYEEVTQKIYINTTEVTKEQLSQIKQYIIPMNQTQPQPQIPDPIIQQPIPTYQTQQTTQQPLRLITEEDLYPQNAQKQPTQKKSKKTLFIILGIIIFLLLSCCGVGTVLYFTGADFLDQLETEMNDVDEEITDEETNTELTETVWQLFADIDDAATAKDVTTFQEKVDVINVVKTITDDIAKGRAEGTKAFFLDQNPEATPEEAQAAADKIEFGWTEEYTNGTIVTDEITSSGTSSLLEEYFLFEGKNNILKVEEKDNRLEVLLATPLYDTPISSPPFPETNGTFTIIFVKNDVGEYILKEVLDSADEMAVMQCLEFGMTAE